MRFLHKDSIIKNISDQNTPSQYVLRIARTERKISQSELAKRLNVSRYTVMAIEKGNPKVAIGAVFEAAMIVGIPLLADNGQALNTFAQRAMCLSAILPKRVRMKPETFHDAF